MTQLNAAEKMLKTKRKLIARLKEEINIVLSNADQEVASLKRRIKIAETLVSALEKGTLKP